jgi:hypothetical protein
MTDRQSTLGFNRRLRFRRRRLSGARHVCPRPGRPPGSKQGEQIEELIVELRDFGRIVPGIVVDELEYLLPFVPSGHGFEHLREHEIKCADGLYVADAPSVAVDFRADCLFVLRLGIGQPFQKIAEFIDPFGGRQMDPVIDGARRCI